MTAAERDRAHTHYRGLLARLEDERAAPRELCVRCKRLPREFGDLCEPCWEIGRDEPPEDFDGESGTSLTEESV